MSNYHDTNEMRLFSGRGERLYLTADERERFLIASLDADHQKRWS